LSSIPDVKKFNPTSQTANSQDAVVLSPLETCRKRTFLTRERVRNPVISQHQNIYTSFHPIPPIANITKIFRLHQAIQEILTLENKQARFQN